MQGSGAGFPEICHRYGKLRDCHGSARSVVHCGGGSVGIRVGTAYIDRGGGIPVSASDLAFYHESQEKMNSNFNSANIKIS